MNEDRHLNGANPDETAVDWLLIFDAGASPLEVDEFERWVSASESNAKAWARASKAWGEFDEEPDPLLTSMHQSALRMRRSVWTTTVARVAMAAGVAGLAVGVSLWNPHMFLGMADNAARVSRPAPTAFASSGEVREILLGDGTRVRLDARSRILVEETSGRRDVKLQEGQAFFDVTHDAHRPFVVASADRTVTAVGTAFAVSLKTGALSVVLARGRVVVASDDAETFMAPGQQYQVGPDGTARVTSVDVDRVLEWQQGYVELRDVTVRDALARMNVGAWRQVAVGDDAAGSLKVSGRFRAANPTHFVESLSSVYPVRLKTKPNGDEVVVSVKRSTL